MLLQQPRRHRRVLEDRRAEAQRTERPRPAQHHDSVPDGRQRVVAAGRRGVVGPPRHGAHPAPCGGGGGSGCGRGPAEAEVEDVPVGQQRGPVVAAVQHHEAVREDVSRVAPTARGGVALRGGARDSDDGGARLRLRCSIDPNQSLVLPPIVNRGRGWMYQCLYAALAFALTLVQRQVQRSCAHLCIDLGPVPGAEIEAPEVVQVAGAVEPAVHEQSARNYHRDVAPPRGRMIPCKRARARKDRGVQERV